MGLNFKLDIGTFRFCLQVACQRYRQQSIIAKLSDFVASVKESVRGYAVALFGTPATQLV